MKKSVLSIVVIISLIFSCVPVTFANEADLPDIVITSVALSNPYYNSGDMIHILVTIQNIGLAATKGEWIGLDLDAERQDTQKAGFMAIMQPGDTKTLEFGNFEAKSKTIRYSCVADSYGNIVESNKNNNAYSGILKSLTPASDLIVSDIKLINESVKVGDNAVFEITVKNSGIKDMDYTSMSLDISIDCNEQTISDIYKLESKQEVKIKTKPVKVLKQSFDVVANVNRNKKVKEALYDNNIMKKTIKLIEVEKYDWDSVKIGGGGQVIGGVIHPTEPNLMYVRTDVGGAYRFDYENRKWISITDSIPLSLNNFYGIYSIAIDPLDPNVVYICAGQNSIRQQKVYGTPLMPCDVLKSNDRGKTFKRTNLNIDFDTNKTRKWLGEAIAVDPNNSDIIYVGGPYDGLWKSVNATKDAIKWEKVDLPNFTPKNEVANTGGIRSVLFDKNTVKNGITQTIYVGISDVGIYRTTDGGKVWNFIENSPKMPARMDIRNDGKLFVTVENEGVKTLLGNQWEDITPHGDAIGFSGISINPKNQDQIVLAERKSAFRNKMYYSENGGRDWVNLRDNAVGVSDVTWWGNEKFGACIDWIIFDWNKDGRVWFGDWYGIWVTDDIFAKESVWTTHQTGHEEMVLFDIATPKAGARLLTALADNDGIRHTDIGDFPSEQFRKPHMSDGNGIDVCESDPNIIARVGGYSWGKRGDGGYSLDNGKSWEPFPFYPTDSSGVKKPNGRVTISSTKNQNGIPTIVVVPISSKPYRTTDYGKTWAEISSLPGNGVAAYWSSNIPLASDLVDGNIFYYYSTEGFLYTSVDNAKTFTKAGVLPGAAKNFVRTAPNRKGEVWVSLNAKGLYKSSNFGATFEPVKGVQASYLMGFGKESPGTNIPTAYVFGKVNNVEGVFRSTDLGETWVKISDEQNAFGCDPKCLEGDRQTFGVVYIGNGGRGIYVGKPKDVDISAPKIYFGDMKIGSIDVDTKKDTVRESAYIISGMTTENSIVTYTINGGVPKEIPLDSSLKFKQKVELTEGNNKIIIMAVDAAGNRSANKTIDVMKDSKYLEILLKNNDYCIDLSDNFTISGSVNVSNNNNIIKINDTDVQIKSDNTFITVFPLSDGINEFAIIAKDNDGNEIVKKCIVNKDVFDPEITLDATNTITSDNMIIIRGRVNEAATVSIGKTKMVVNKDNDFTFNIPVALKKGVNNIELIATDLVDRKTPLKIDVTSTYDGDISNHVVVGVAKHQISDGLFDEPEWNFNGLISNVVMGESDNVAKFALLGDADNLYVGIKVYDNNVYPNVSASSSENDNVEIYIDATNSKSSAYDGGTSQICLFANGTITATQGNLKGAVSKMVVTDYGYNIELTLPWKALKISPISNYTFGFDININDNDKGKGRDGVSAWAGDNSNWESAKNFGFAHIFERK